MKKNEVVEPTMSDALNVSIRTTNHFDNLPGQLLSIGEDEDRMSKHALGLRLPVRDGKEVAR
eukprot:34162-Eustigmatos_ZCMA.PRE.1